VDLWNPESYLTQSRREIDRKYDYRQSVLTEVLGKLVREGRLSKKKCVGWGTTSWCVFAPMPSFWPGSTQWRKTKDAAAWAFDHVIYRKSNAPPSKYSYILDAFP